MSGRYPNVKMGFSILNVHEVYDQMDHTALGMSPREAFEQGILLSTPKDRKPRESPPLVELDLTRILQYVEYR